SAIMKLELVKRQILSATRALVPAERICVYAVDENLTPYAHLSDGKDSRWVSLYSKFRDVDPFHPRYFAHDTSSSVFLTQQARGPAGHQDAFINGFRRPMGIHYKAEVFM